MGALAPPCNRNSPHICSLEVDREGGSIPIDDRSDHLLSDRFFGDLVFSTATNACPAGVGLTVPPLMICSALTSLPYSSLLAPPSARSVVPSSETPANAPLDRE